MKDLLTKAESKVYDLMIAGLSNETIAEKLFVAVKSVKFHITHIFAKVGVTSRYELMAKHYKFEIERIREKHQQDIDQILLEDFKRAKRLTLLKGGG